MVINLCIVLTMGLLSEPAPLPQPSAPVSAIELIETEPRKVAFVEHTGAYWSLGSVIDTVARDARAVGSRGHLLIRYISNPASPPGVVLAQVGYELSGRDLPKPPYQVTEWPRSLVVTKTIAGADGLSPRHQAALKSWISDEGLVPSGDLIALVELAENGGSTAIEQIKIQMPVCLPDPPAPEPAAELVPALPTSIAVDMEPADSVVTKVITLPSRRIDEHPSDAEPEKTNAPMPLAVDPPPTSATVRTEIELPPQRPAIGVRLLIEDENFVELARAILPDDADAASKRWADELIGRIIALTNGVRKLAPGEEGWLIPLAGELGTRRDQLRAIGAKTPRRVIGPTGSTTDRLAERNFVILEIDRLMAGLAYGSFNPDQVREKLTEILEVAPTLVTLH